MNQGLVTLDPQVYRLVGSHAKNKEAPDCYRQSDPARHQLWLLAGHKLLGREDMGAGFTTPFKGGYAVPIVPEGSTWLRQQKRRRAVHLGLQVGSGRISTLRYALAAIST